MICKKLVVDEDPTEGIWNYNNDAFHCSSVCGFAHVRVQAMELDNGTPRLALVDAAFETIWAGHVAICRGVFYGSKQFENDTVVERETGWTEMNGGGRLNVEPIDQ